MKKLIISSLIIIMFSSNIAVAQNAFTQKDRELLIELMVTMEQMDKRIDQRFKQMEKQIDQRFQQVDQRFQQMDKRIDDIQTYMLWGFGILFAGMIGLFMRDRKIAIKPAVKKITSSSKKEKLFETILKDFAKDQPKLAEILKEHGL